MDRSVSDPRYGRAMDAMDRLRRATAARAHEKFFADGYGWIGREDTDAAREEARASERELQLVLREFSENGRLEDKHHGNYMTTPHFALWYETDLDRAAFYERNHLRRKMLATLLDADEGGFAGFDFNAPMKRAGPSTHKANWSRLEEPSRYWAWST